MDLTRPLAAKEEEDVEILESSGGWIWEWTQRSAVQHRRAVSVCLGLLDSLQGHLQGLFVSLLFELDYY